MMKMNIFKGALVGIFAIFLCKCGKDEVNLHINSIKKIFPIIETNGWKIDEVVLQYPVKMYNLRKTHSDTLYFLDFDFIITDSSYDILSPLIVAFATILIR